MKWGHSGFVNYPSYHGRSHKNQVCPHYSLKVLPETSGFRHVNRAPAGPWDHGSFEVHGLTRRRTEMNGVAATAVTSIRSFLSATFSICIESRSGLSCPRQRKGSARVHFLPAFESLWYELLSVRADHLRRFYLMEYPHRREPVNLTRRQPVRDAVGWSRGTIRVSAEA